MPNAQPVMPAEGVYTDIEELFISEQPPGLFPENQNSNFGTLRRVLTEPLQDAADQLTLMFNELFIDTSSAFLSRWETEMDLPDSTGVLSDTDRRSRILARRERGAFTRSRLRRLIERHISATFGEPPLFSGAGLPFGAGGIVLHAEFAPVTTLYRIYEDFRNFSFEVWIKNTVTPDLSSLNREITRISPYIYTIDNTVVNALSYSRTIRNKQPELRLALDNFTDSSGYANNGAGNGGIVGGAGGTLINAAVAGGSVSTIFDGVDDFISVPNAQQLMARDNFTIEAWVRPEGALQVGTIAAKDQWQLRITAAGKVQLLKTGVVMAESTNALALNTIYHIVVRKNINSLSIKINNAAEVLAVNAPATLADSTGVFRVGSKDGASEFFRGRLDEVAFYQRSLSDAEISDNYNTGINVP